MNEDFCLRFRKLHRSCVSYCLLRLRGLYKEMTRDKRGTCYRALFVHDHETVMVSWMWVINNAGDSWKQALNWWNSQRSGTILCCIVYNSSSISCLVMFCVSLRLPKYKNQVSNYLWFQESCMCIEIQSFCITWLYKSTWRIYFALLLLLLKCLLEFKFQSEDTQNARLSIILPKICFVLFYNLHFQMFLLLCHCLFCIEFHKTQRSPCPCPFF